MKHLKTLALSLAAAASLCAAEPGLGFSVSNDSNAITAPIRLKGGIVLEPGVYFSNENEHSGSSKYKYKQYGVEFGVFKHHEIAPSMEFFYGASLYAGQRREKDEYTSSSYKYINNVIGLQPTVGLEYQVNKKVSFGGKVGLDMYHEKECGYDSQYNSQSTFSSLFVRMYF
nr:hypothetical protein [uncultured Holophaga sp.]